MSSSVAKIKLKLHLSNKSALMNGLSMVQVFSMIFWEATTLYAEFECLVLFGPKTL